MGTCDFVAGWAGVHLRMTSSNDTGVLGLVTGHPFDTIKVNQQNMGIKFWECTRQIFLTQGVNGYFRGMAFPIVAASSINSIYFGVYRVSLERMLEYRKEDKLFELHRRVDSNLNENKEVNRKHSYTDTFVAGCIGGTAQLLLTIPVELVKIKLQTTSKTATTVQYQGPLDVVRRILKTQGIRGLYAGTGVTALRDIPSSGVYMCGYAVFSDWLQMFDLLKDGNGDVSPNAMRTLIAGGLAGTLSWWSIIPFDVVKSRIQADNPLNPRYNGWLDCSQQIYRKHGLTGFTRGILPLTLRAFPVNAVTFLGYEWTNSLCNVVASKFW